MLPDPNAFVNLVLRSSSSLYTACGSWEVVCELFKSIGSVLMTAYTTVDPDRTPTIFILPVSIPKNAQIFVMNDVSPLFE